VNLFSDCDTEDAGSHVPPKPWLTGYMFPKL